MSRHFVYWRLIKLTSLLFGEFLRFLRAPLRSFVLGDQLRFGEQHFAKRAEHVQQQVELSQTLATRAYCAEKEFECIRRRQSAIVTMQVPHLYSPPRLDSTSVSM